MRSSRPLWWLLLALLACGGPTVVATAPQTPDRRAASADAGAAPAAAPSEPVPKGQLPRDARPTHERLALTIDPDADRFTGSAAIDVTLERPRDVLWLHGRGLSVSSCTLTLPSGERLAASWTEVDPSGVARLSLPRAVAGNASIEVAFSAPYDASLVGVYRTDVQGGGHAVFSKFEAIYARRAFPCWDEPSFKVPFDVRLTVPKRAVALGNMPASSSEDQGDKTTVTFATTPPLPTYLVAIAVGPFTSRPGSVPPSATRPSALPFAVTALRGREGGAAFAAAETPPIVRHQESYYGVPFPFPKLTLLAVPDFQSGAMENAGLITFREAALLVDAQTSTLTQRIGVLKTVAHEVAHQWFGDLVTMGWWDDLWLNESFASFLGMRTVRETKPELELELDDVLRANDVMQTDGLGSARRIRQPIGSTDDITNAFDGITYQKGEAILEMVEGFVGPGAFQRGLHDYLVAHAGGNATTGDLVSALSKASGKDLGPLFASFLDQAGVPLVTAKATCEGGQGRLALTQERWLPFASSSPKDLAWTVPVCAKASVGGKVQTSCAVLDPEAPSGTSLDLGACADWVMPNVNARGYYRFALDRDGLLRLTGRELAHLTTAERLSLAGDIDALLRSATLSAKDALDAIEPLARDPHGAVATSPLALFRLLIEEVLDGASAAKLRAHVRRLYAPAAAALGWRRAPGESAWRALERTTLLTFLAMRMEDAKVLAEGARLGRAYLGLGPGGAAGDGALHPEAVDADLAGLAAACAVRTGDARVWEAVERAALESEDPARRRALLLALASTTDPKLGRRALDLALRPRLRKMERLITVQALLDGRSTRDAAWTWLRENFDELAGMLPDRYPGYVPLAVHSCDAKRADEVSDFFAPRARSLTGGPRNLALAIERVKSCAALADKQRASAASFVAR
jgi:alanyl aminopeptidase